MNFDQLIAAAREAIAAGDLEKATKLKEQAAMLQSIDAMAAPAVDVQAIQQENEELKAFKQRVENEPAMNKSARVVVTEDETEKKAAKPFRTFGEQMKAVAQAALYPHRMDERLKAQKAILGQNETVDSEGGFLVQTDFSTEIFKVMHDTSTIASRCRPWPISSSANGTKINAVKESSRATGSRYGGVRAYWVAEGGDITASSMDFRQIALDLNKLAAVVYATDEILADTTQLNTLMTTAVPDELNFVLEDSIIDGDGAGKPHGILNSNALVAIAKETGQAASTVLGTNIVKMWARAWGRSRMNAVWLINQDVEPQLMEANLPIGTGGVPVYLPAGGYSQSPYGTLFGRPVIPTEYNKTLGTVGDVMLVDFSQYLLASKVAGGIETAESIHVQFLTDQTAFRFIYRVDGQPAWESAMTPYNGSNTLSPFVALATRS